MSTLLHKRRTRLMARHTAIGAIVVLVSLLFTACAVPIFEVFISTDGSGSVDSVADYGPEDILVWDDGSGAWSMYFDGSDHGLQRGKHDIEAISVWISDTNDIYMSFFQNKVTVPEIGQVFGQEIIKFTEAGHYERYFDGTDVGLTTVSEKIDAMEIIPFPDDEEVDQCEALLFISTLGEYSIPAKYTDGFGKLTGDGSNLLLFCATNVGPDGATAGFGGPSDIVGVNFRDEGMPKNYLDSLAFPTAYFTTPGAFNVDSAFGGHSEVYGWDGDFFGPVISAPDEGITQFVDALSIPFCPEFC